MVNRYRFKCSAGFSIDTGLFKNADKRNKNVLQVWREGRTKEEHPPQWKGETAMGRLVASGKSSGTTRNVLKKTRFACRLLSFSFVQGDPARSSPRFVTQFSYRLPMGEVFAKLRCRLKTNYAR